MMIGVGSDFIFGVIDGLTSARGAFPMSHVLRLCVLRRPVVFAGKNVFQSPARSATAASNASAGRKTHYASGPLSRRWRTRSITPAIRCFLTRRPTKKPGQSVAPILGERAEEKGDFKVGVFPYSKFKQEIAALSERMKRNCERIKRIVEDLRSFAKKDIDLNEDVNVNTVIRSSLSVIEHVTGKCTRNLRLHLSEPIPCVKGSVRHLEQVVINIVKNACQSLASADKAVSISTSCVENNVIITVSDEGKGMDEEMVKNIFTPFYTTKGKEGTGLGLCDMQQYHQEPRRPDRGEIKDRERYGRYGDTSRFKSLIPNKRIQKE